MTSPNAARAPAPEAPDAYVSPHQSLADDALRLLSDALGAPVPNPPPRPVRSLLATLAYWHVGSYPDMASGAPPPRLPPRTPTHRPPARKIHEMPAWRWNLDEARHRYVLLLHTSDGVMVVAKPSLDVDEDLWLVAGEPLEHTPVVGPAEAARAALEFLANNP